MPMPDVITLQNGEKVPGTFSRREMDRRMARLRALMDAERDAGTLR